MPITVGTIIALKLIAMVFSNSWARSNRWASWFKFYIKIIWALSVATVEALRWILALFSKQWHHWYRRQCNRRFFQIFVAVQWFVPYFLVFLLIFSLLITWVFPGQGSQEKGMGATLFDEFADLTAQADAILGYSIQELCLNDPQKQLNR